VIFICCDALLRVSWRAAAREAARQQASLLLLAR
jgi:hypothetical protein